MTSLIIITLNRSTLLKRTLDGLAMQSRPIDEIIVVDNAPTPDTERVVCSSAARYVPEPKRGYGHARNRGLAEARGEVIYFLDDDCVPEPDWSDILWHVLESGDADLASGSRAPGQPGLAARLEYLSTDGPVLSPRIAAGPARHLSTSNLILRREVIEKTGCFDTTLTMCEDRDFTTRARKRGFRLRYEPKARVTHYPAIRGLADYLGKMRHYGTGTSEYFLRWHDEEPLARLFPSNPALRLLMLPALAAAGTGYLVARNLPQNPDALPLAPLLFAGQVYWHWGGFQAVRAC
ncbi:MAG TPA: glycosyltransferase family A protein [Bryobacteraceae bacterium]|nr:glycosyltransferase family A protein [Bryobacteraceae bacterium]